MCPRTWAAAWVVVVGVFCLFCLLQERCCRTLVIVLAETRAHSLTYERFKRNVLDVLQADLAVCVKQEKAATTKDPFRANAKFIWEYDEPSDFGKAFDEAAEGLHWRVVLRLKDQLFGGIRNPANQHPGSAGILIFYRWFLLQSLSASNVIGKYDAFIVTRSDYYYEHPHPVLTLPLENIWMPEGEDYGGYTDRHIVLPRKFLYSALSLMDPIIQNPVAMFRSMRFRRNWNLERYIRYHFEKNGLVQYVRRFPRPMYAVRETDGKTRWATGEYVPEVNMIVKYISEFKSVSSNPCHPDELVLC